MSVNVKPILENINPRRQLLHFKKNENGCEHLIYNTQIGNSNPRFPKGITSTRNMFEGCVLPDGFKIEDFDTSEVTDL